MSPADYRALKEVCLALVEPNSLPPDAALALYVAIDGQHWIFRGFVSNEHPSDVMPLSWPEEDASMQAMPRHAVIGISIEPLGMFFFNIFLRACVCILCGAMCEFLYCIYDDNRTGLLLYGCWYD